MSILLKLVVFVCAITALFPQHFHSLSNATEPVRIESYSQASQDQFVYLLLYELLHKQDAGSYLEIGAGHPSSGNNSYSFEKTLGWKGISIDITDACKRAWYSSRQNPLLIEDATQSDYRSVLQSFPKVIDYLSLDIDNSYDVVLRRIPFDEHTFKIITIEHDFYRYGDTYRQAEREILTSLGYHLLCPNVVIFYNGKDSAFEDWWIHPSAFPDDVLSLLTSLDLKEKRHDQLIDTIRAHYDTIKYNLKQGGRI